MKNAHYIDTRPGAPGFFAPPGEVADYAAWLRAQYQAAIGRDGDRKVFSGVAQKINAIAYAAKTAGDEVMAFGPYAGAAAAVLEELAGGTMQVEVLW